VIEQFDNVFRNGGQLEAETGVPVLGLVPQVRLPPGHRIDTYLAEKPASSYAEAFRIVWFSLKHAVPEGGLRVLLVTSSVPEEGKSVTALSLARTAAKMSLKVALVDADVRRPSIGRMLGVAPVKGIAEILKGEATLDEAMMRDPLSSVDVLMPSAPQAIDLMATSTDLARLVSELRERYDLVVIDSPPTMPVADVQVLARLADYTLFCVRWNETPRASVVASVRSLVAANVAGTLLTRVNIRKHARYGYGDVGYYYGKYPGYYSP
jgi:capsular exopolysaccharide synthesis family protein